MSDIPRIGPASGPFENPAEDETIAALRGALFREAERVAPSRDGLQRIQRQVRAGQVRRPGPWLGRLTPALTAAAAVAVLAVAGAVAVRLTQEPPGGAGGPAAQPISTVTSTSQAPENQVPVYVTGQQGGKKWLFREYRNTYAMSTENRVADAITDAVNLRPLDSDYDQPLFRGGPNSQATATVSPSEITVTLTAAMVSRHNVGQSAARLALAQLVWTATAAAGRGPDAPVRFLVDRGDQTLFGTIPLDRSYTRSEFSPNPCAPLWITSLVEGTDVGHKSFTVSGDAGVGQGGTVTWALKRDGVEIATGEATVKTAPPGTTRREWSFAPLTGGQKGDYELTVTLRPGTGSGLSTDVTWQDTRTFVIN
jgi:hypothetical protein